MAVIELKGVGLQANGQWLLQKISLALPAGSFFLLFGANGAGKTSLLRVLAGLQPGFTGTVHLDGRDLRLLGWRELARFRAYVSQSDEFSLPISAREVLSASRYARRSPLAGPTRIDTERIDEVAARFGLCAYLDRDVRLLSGGERKRVLLASALVQDVPLVCLDEPLNSLDPGGIGEVLSMLRSFRNEGRTIIVVSHQLDVFFPLADYMAALKKGRLAYFGEKRFLPALLREVYGVGAQQVSAGGRTVVCWDEN